MEGGVATFNQGASNFRAPGSFMGHGPRMGGFRPSGPPGFRPRFPLGDALAYDGKRMRNKTVMRKTVDYNASVMAYVENRIWQRDQRDQRALQTDQLYLHTLQPPSAMLETPLNGACTRFVRQATNKIKCPIFCVVWTPEGRRLITGASSGEFTLWNGLTFNFETILQAHDTSVRAMVWSHNDNWMLTADHAGFIKYWQSNMNNVKMYQAHKDPVRGLSFCPTDSKFASCSDDGTVRIWDFLHCNEERILRGHGADVKCVDWHPQKALVASGSKDTQQPLKLWDPRVGTSLATIHAHKHTVMEVKWNRNGNWLLTASRDHLLKLFDIRNMKEELQSFKGHRKEATTVAWHPIHETLFASGGSDGQIMYWLVGTEKEVGSINEAHETMVWSLAWHPMGHILVSGSNDHTSKFWTRNRPGDRMRDRYNLNTLPAGMSEDMLEFDEYGANIPGMGLESLPGIIVKEQEKAAAIEGAEKKEIASSTAGIPGLDMSARDNASADQETVGKQQPHKKIPFAKPVPKDFELAWSGAVQPEPFQMNGPPPGPPPGHPDFRGPPPRGFHGPPPRGMPPPNFRHGPGGPPRGPAPRGPAPRGPPPRQPAGGSRPMGLLGDAPNKDMEEQGPPKYNKSDPHAFNASDWNEGGPPPEVKEDDRLYGEAPPQGEPFNGPPPARYNGPPENEDYENYGPDGYGSGQGDRYGGDGYRGRGHYSQNARGAPPIGRGGDRGSRGGERGDRGGFQGPPPQQRPSQGWTEETEEVEQWDDNRTDYEGQGNGSENAYDNRPPPRGGPHGVYPRGGPPSGGASGGWRGRGGGTTPLLDRPPASSHDSASSQGGASSGAPPSLLSMDLAKPPGISKRNFDDGPGAPEKADHEHFDGSHEAGDNADMEEQGIWSDKRPFGGNMDNGGGEDGSWRGRGGREMGRGRGPSRGRGGERGRGRARGGGPPRGSRGGW